MSIFDIYPIYPDWCLLRDARPPKPLSILGVGQGALEENRPVATHCTRAKLMGLIADLGRGALGLDTVIFLYFIENNSLVPSAP